MKSLTTLGSNLAFLFISCATFNSSPGGNRLLAMKVPPWHELRTSQMKTYVTEREKERKRERSGELFQSGTYLSKRPHNFNLSNQTQIKFGA